MSLQHAVFLSPDHGAASESRSPVTFRREPLLIECFAWSIGSIGSISSRGSKYVPASFTEAEPARVVTAPTTSSWTAGPYDPHREERSHEMLRSIICVPWTRRRAGSD